MNSKKIPLSGQSGVDNPAETPPKQQAPLKITRRAMLPASAIAVLMLGSHQSNPALASQSLDEIHQLPNPAASDFMDRAFEMREIAVERGDQAYGAIVVRNNQIVGQSWSRVVIDRDPTAHAEMSAIRDAARRLDDRDLTGTIMFSSSRPCPMCEAAAFWAGIGQLVYGRNLNSAGSPKLCC
ncbi:MAG: nucleoside deaminase [Boseongicola sp.]